MDVNPRRSKAFALEPIEVSTTGGDAGRAAANESSADAKAQRDLRIGSADEFLAAAAREYQTGNIDQALWRRAAEQCGDDAAFVPQCNFCNHANPPGAKFCNDCGSPLHLKPCKQCEAVNGRVAKNCYQCGTEFPALSTAPETAPVSPALDAPAASATLIGMDFERGHAADVVPLHNLAAAAGRRPVPRLALVVVLPTAMLIAISVSVYFVYRDQVQTSGWVSAAPPDPAAPTGVMASPVKQSGNPATGPDGVNGQTPTPGQSDAASTPQLPVSTSDQAAPAQQLATQAAEVAGAPGAGAGTIAAERHTTMRATTNPVASAHSATNPSTSPDRAAAAAAPVQFPPSDSRVNVPPDAPDPYACTEAVAALGLCSPTSRSESK